MIPCSGFREEVQSVGTGTNARRNLLTCHPPPFRRVTKNGKNCLHAWHAGFRVGV